MSQLIRACSRMQLLCRSSPQSLVRFCSKQPAKSEISEPSTTPTTANRITGTHKVNEFERKILVWTGKYKTTEEVPDYINQEVMERARNRTRIRLANILMVLTAIGCMIAVWSGKRAAKNDESLQKQNLEWHSSYNKKKNQEEWGDQFEKMAKTGAGEK